MAVLESIAWPKPAMPEFVARRQAPMPASAG